MATPHCHFAITISLTRGAWDLVDQVY